MHLSLIGSQCKGLRNSITSQLRNAELKYQSAQLDLLVNKAITIINFSHYRAFSDPVYITLDILPLQKLVTHRFALMMYKYSHGMLQQIIQDF